MEQDAGTRLDRSLRAHGDASSRAIGSISTRARRVCAVVFSVIVTGIAGLHAYWAFGGLWGIYEGSGRNFPAGESLSPGWRLGTWGLVVLLFAGASLVLVRAGIVPLRMPRLLVVGGCWVVAMVMLCVAIGDFGGSSNWSRAVFAPVALVLSVLVAVVAAPSRGRTMQRSHLQSAQIPEATRRES